MHVLNDQTILRKWLQETVSGKTWMKTQEELTQCAVTYNPCITVDGCLLACFFNYLGHFHTTQGCA